ncbi:MAG: hypothetical protein KatS3mg102_2013 [Planctomycetota bacterium]|nr:MAG: hypothetical protein KatS3mg102_2013 [Planctomycetota bacterium]
MLDLAELAAAHQQLRLVLRLHRGLLAQHLEEQAAEELLAAEERGRSLTDAVSALWVRIQEQIETYADAPLLLLDALEALEGLPARWQHWLRALRSLADRGAPLQLEFPYGEQQGAILYCPRRAPAELLAAWTARQPALVPSAQASTEVETGSFLAREVSLQEHSRCVWELARGLAQAAGLPRELVDDIALAALLHDLGKADRRFQVYLCGGDELAALLAPAPLAKSGRAPGPAELRRARRAAALPRGWRHESCSVQLAQALLCPGAAAGSSPRLWAAVSALLGISQAEATPSDPDLVLWLIGTHHGHGRPLFPPLARARASGWLELQGAGGAIHQVAEREVGAGPHRLEAGWAERFERLRRRYGPWELARMEAVVRLADHRASEREQQGDGGTA